MKKRNMSAGTPFAFSHLLHRIKQLCNILFELSAQFFDWGNNTSICVRRMKHNWWFMCPWTVFDIVFHTVLEARVRTCTIFAKCVSLHVLSSLSARSCVCVLLWASMLSFECRRFIFTHSVAVHEKDPERLSALIFQTEEEGVMSIEVVGSLRGGKTRQMSEDEWKCIGKRGVREQEGL